MVGVAGARETESHQGGQDQRQGGGDDKAGPDAGRRADKPPISGQDRSQRDRARPHPKTVACTSAGDSRPIIAPKAGIRAPMKKLASTKVVTMKGTVGAAAVPNSVSPSSRSQA